MGDGTEVKGEGIESSRTYATLRDVVKTLWVEDDDHQTRITPASVYDFLTQVRAKLEDVLDLVPLSSEKAVETAMGYWVENKHLQITPQGNYEPTGIGLTHLVMGSGLPQPYTTVCASVVGEWKQKWRSK